MNGLMIYDGILYSGRLVLTRELQRESKRVRVRRRWHNHLKKPHEDCRLRAFRAKRHARHRDRTPSELRKVALVGSNKNLSVAVRMEVGAATSLGSMVENRSSDQIV